MNLIILTGRLTKNPEIKYGQNGKAYSRFSLAVDRPFQKGETDFINCVTFGKTAELVKEYLKKGRKIGIQGRIQMNRYETNGEKRTSYDVVVDSIEFLESRDNNSSTSSSLNDNVNNEPEEFADDEFPF